MHRPRHLHTAVAMRVSAALLILAGLLLLAALVVAGYALVDIDRPLLLIALSLFVGGVASLLGYRILAASARCSLCMQPVLLGKPCSRSDKVTTLWGSYRLKVARDITLKKNFRCPYCGEPTLCVAKERPPEPQPEQERPAGPQDPGSW